MSRENVEIVRRINAAFQARDTSAVVALTHPDIEMDATRNPIAGLKGVYRGFTEVAQFWQGWYEAWDSVTIEDPELIDTGESVISWTARMKMRGRTSGIEVAMPEFGWVSTFRDGKVVRATLYMDKKEALEAAGLSE